MVLKSQEEYDFQRAALSSIAPKSGCTPETLRTCIVGWRVASLMETTFVLDTLEQAQWARTCGDYPYHSDKRSQYVSLAYAQRLMEAGLLASTGSTGDSYDNAMADSINGLYYAEVIAGKTAPE